MANVVNCVATGSPILLEFLIPYSLFLGVHRNVNVLLQSTCLQQFLILVVRAQLGNFVTDCLAHLMHSTFRGWRQVKGSKQKLQLFESYGCGGDSGIQL